MEKKEYQHITDKAIVTVILSNVNFSSRSQFDSVVVINYLQIYSSITVKMSVSLVTMEMFHAL
jgi:hypothetical protein